MPCSTLIPGESVFADDGRWRRIARLGNEHSRLLV